MYPATFAAATPDKPAVVMVGGESLTYLELEHRSAHLAHYLRARGLERGDGVVLLSENSPRVYEVYWATQRSGLYFTAVNHHLAPAEAAYIVADSGAKALIVSATLADLAAAIVASGAAPELLLSYGGDVPGFTDLDAATADQPDTAPDDQPRGTDMLYSSGTTGRPKGIRPTLPDRQIDEPGDTYAALFGPMYGFDANTVYLSPAPLYHAAPLRFSATVQALGGTVVVLPRFEPEAALDAIESYRATHSQWVPTMFVRMLKLPAAVRERYDVSSLRVAIHAAAPCPVEVKHAMIDWWGPVLYEYYSSTEGNGITFIDSAQWLQRPGSVGLPGLGVLHICDDDGTELPTGAIGTVFFERDVVPFGYHNDPEKTLAGQHPDHPTWSTTGDLGYVDEAGYLFLTDRKAFMIISGGVNIYPQEIEDCLILHPAVFDVAVIGVPDDEMGESVKAVVQTVDAVAATPELAAELVAFARARIAHYKVPSTVDFTDELPRTPTGKLVKGPLRDRYRVAG